MEPTEVVSVDDILAAADTKLNAPAEKPVAKPQASPDPDPEPEPSAPDGEPAGEKAPPEGEEPEDGEPAGEPSIDVDGEKLTPQQIRQLRADAQMGKQQEQDRLAAQYLIDHPEEYERLQRERGARPRAEKPAEPQQPAGPNPLDNPQGWKYDRFNQYVAYLSSQGKTATPDAIAAQVELDHVAARTEQMHADMMADRASRAEERAQVERNQAQWRQDQEANQIAQQLRPLFAKYPNAATPEGQKDVEAHIIRAIHLGEPVNYEAIVKRVHGSSAAAVKTWADKKKAMAAGTGVASGRGGSAQGSRQKLVDRLPADVSSIMEYAERAGRGEQ